MFATVAMRFIYANFRFEQIFLLYHYNLANIPSKPVC